jgi:dTDP-4-dehydrorhamnose reductase
MKILITGANGLLGQKLVDLLKEKEGISLVATSRGKSRIDFSPYESMDIINRKDVERVIGLHKPDVIIHTAAMTNVDQCESEKEGCLDLNVNAVRYLVESSERHNVFFVHLSTDFIFDGEDGPYKEDDEPNPVSFYGQSKLDAEMIVRQSNLKWAIARTILVYGITSKMSRSNIILWVKKSLEESKPIKVVTDQWRTPTLAEDLAMGCYLIARDRAEGIFNISGKDMLTPYEMAMMTADYFELDKSFISKADSSTFSQPAKRPPRTGLDIDKARDVLGYEPHSFREGIEVLASQLKVL